MHTLLLSGLQHLVTPAAAAHSKVPHLPASYPLQPTDSTPPPGHRPCRPTIEIKRDYGSASLALSTAALQAASKEAAALRTAVREHGLPVVVESLGGPLAVLRLATLTLGGCPAKLLLTSNLPGDKCRALPIGQALVSCVCLEAHMKLARHT